MEPKYIYQIFIESRYQIHRVVESDEPNGMDGVNDGDVGSSTTGRDTTGRECSIVWDYFEKKTGDDGVRRGKCTRCSKLLKANQKSGTSNLKRHIEKCFDIDLGDVSTSPKKRIKLDQMMYREKLALSIIKHNYPFSYVEHEATRDVHKFLHPDAKPITRNTAKADVLKVFEREKSILKGKLEKIPSRVCLTADLWSSITSDGYMALTAHYVDENWVLRKKVLNFRVVPPPHTGSILGEYVVNFCKDWGIEKKVFTITLDNAKYNDNLVDSLKLLLGLDNGLICNGDFMHVRCGVHVLNLIVQAGLKVIEGAIAKVRESVKYVRGSSSRKFKFAECIARLDLQCGKHVRQDVVTRWNSTYLMLDCALAYGRAYARLQLVDKDFKTCPTDEEWERIKEITTVLKPFYDITTLFSGSSYPTANLYFHNVWKIQSLIKDKVLSSDKIISNMAKGMKEKFDKYWANYSLVLSFAVVLDPRYKLKMVEFSFAKLGMSDIELEEKVETVRDGLKKLFLEYEILSDSQHDSFEVGTSNVGDGYVDDLTGFETYQSRFDRPRREKESQLDHYLNEPPLDRKSKIDVLKFWKDNEGRYPQLALMARDILSIPITTVASESSFSIGGHILNKYRSSLLPANAEALLCTRDWLFDREGIDEDEMDEEGLIEDIEALIPALRHNIA